ncbi:MAG: DUF1573 domain-containing protein [Flavobacteriales bacterium]|nr:DUF1573 domain-containing protein [Flavobacteriales bacterium]
MKNLVKVFLVCLVSFTVNGQVMNDHAFVVSSSKAGIFEFETETLDYGTIKQHANGERVFTFKNIGNAPIIINKVEGSCGCTVPTKPKEPIFPGETGEIGVKYDSKRIGPFNKSITITSDASESIKVIKIKGVVKEADNEVSSK